jgi:hypothetical protein
MATKFVTTEIKTIKKINEHRDVKLSNYADFSVIPFGNGSVEVVVGAKYKDAVCNAFSKKSLLELAQILKEIGEALPEGVDESLDRL